MFPWLLEPYRLLQQSLANGNLHHAIIFHGKSGVGKSRLVAQLCQALLCHQSSEIGCGQCKSCQLFLAESHPDLYSVQPENQIGVDDIRNVIAKLNASSHLMQAKVLVIHEAHKMTIAAANSLLKTLEEPTRDTYIFLLTDKLDSLLPTIKSRCQKQVISINEKASVESWLAQENLTPEPLLLDMYWYRPLFLQKILENEDGNALRDIDQDIEKVLSGRMSINECVEKYLESIELCLEWMQFNLNEKMKICEGQVHDALWKSNIQITSTVKQLTFTGVNKSLLLSNTLNSFIEALKTV